MRSSDFETLRQMPLFAAMPERDLRELTSGSLVQILPRGAVVCEQGDTADFLYVIIAGRVALVAEESTKEQRQETILEFFGPGDAFVMAAVLLDLPYLLTARVVEETRLLYLPAAKVRSALNQLPGFAAGSALLLARYWRSLVTEIKHLKLHSASRRLVSFLLGLTTSKRGPVKLELPEDRKVVARRLGMTPESLSRAFAQLRPLGVGGYGRQVTVTDIARLHQVAATSKADT